ncbi:hypothetical protein BCT35_22775 [Vibrio lentus]|uniref:hypothetical protein n=1 Tax=Vibrio TaxID=662 RepID=UPI00035E1D7C|nr:MULTISPECIES: hypothetical protein [Vibrio]PMJ93293.1 hypothetical protein BCU11_06060 [Vibrio cyclitrophicus]PMN28746.1 hypothetical protein BCT35_22775 [Vibrio lentus]CAK1830583.1 conserved membrane hypothetical protein [Vibrio crassostreae]CAK3196377.1 conserved membrane hypothetical protein [Vibrio crassostreae]
MKLNNVRDIASLILIFGHILAIALVFFVLHDFFSAAADKMEIALILSPLTGLFAIAALKSIFNNAEVNAKPKIVSVAFASVSIGIPLCFIAMIITTIAMYPFGIASDPQSLKITLSCIEVGLGGLLGLLSEKLFDVNVKTLAAE